MKREQSSTAIAEVEHAREAASRPDWGDAYEILSRIDEESGLAAEDLELLATSAFLTDHREESRSARMRAYHVYVQQGEARRAARCAMRIGLDRISTSEITQAGGCLPASMSGCTAWVVRAHRLPDDLLLTRVNAKTTPMIDTVQANRAQACATPDVNDRPSPKKAASSSDTAIRMRKWSITQISEPAATLRKVSTSSSWPASRGCRRFPSGVRKPPPGPLPHRSSVQSAVRRQSCLLPPARKSHPAPPANVGPVRSWSPPVGQDFRWPSTLFGDPRPCLW